MNRTIVHTATPHNVEEKPVDRHIEAIITNLKEYPRYNYKFTLETTIKAVQVNYCPICQAELVMTEDDKYTDWDCPECKWSGRNS